MGAFKNEKNGTWYVQFRYTDWQGLRQQKLKRGFATKREAQEWERAFLTEKKADVTMPFKTFTELYEKDVRPKLKENTWLTKEHILMTGIAVSSVLFEIHAFYINRKVKSLIQLCRPFEVNTIISICFNIILIS